MSVPIQINDGDFTVAQANGAPGIERPFANAGDVNTFVLKQPMRVDAQWYRPPVIMSKRTFNGLGEAYLVDVTPAIAIANSGLLDFTLVWASIPSSRLEYGKIVYSADVISAGPSGGKKVGQYTGLTSGIFFYEYSIGPLTPYFRPYQDDSIGLRVNGSNISLFGAKISETSTISRYMGLIFERMTPFAYVPPISFYPPPA